MDVGTDGPVAVVDEGLGNSCYLLGLGDGSALVVDPPRDLRAVRAAAAERGLRVRFAADTHLHADFLSGAAQLGHDDGATVLASAAGRRGFPHRGVVDGDEIDLGGLTLNVLATPGHTDEHVAYLLSDGPLSGGSLSGGSDPVGVFSGGSLLVGSAARTDLLGAERTAELARAQFASLHRLAALPAATALWPTHGAGSFCSAPPGADRTSTIGRELGTNALLRLRDEESFVAALLASLGSYPPYFRHLGEINRRGPAVLGPGVGGLEVLPAARVDRLHSDGAVVVDVRSVVDYAAAHIPGAVPIPLRAQFATWLGWLVAPDSPLVIVRDAGQDVEEVVWQAANIGYEDGLIGELDGAMAAWTAAGLPTASTELVAPHGIAGRHVLDIRQQPEFTSGHLPGAVHVELGAVRGAARSLPDGPTVVMCGHGERAAGAAGLLERAGRHDVAVLDGGPDDWADATGRELETGP